MKVMMPTIYLMMISLFFIMGAPTKSFSPAEHGGYFLLFCLFEIFTIWMLVTGMPRKGEEDDGGKKDAMERERV